MPSQLPALASPLMIWVQFAVCVALIGVAGFRLIRYGDAIASRTGMSRSWLGLILVASVTSLPELVTTFAALRIGALDLAVGNLLGSNLFDLLILAFDDLAYFGGSLYSAVSPLHVLSALSACIMSGAVVVALAYHPLPGYAISAAGPAWRWYCSTCSMAYCNTCTASDPRATLWPRMLYLPKCLYLSFNPA